MQLLARSRVGDRARSHPDGSSPAAARYSLSRRPVRGEKRDVARAAFDRPAGRRRRAWNDRRRPGRPRDRRERRFV